MPLAPQYTPAFLEKADLLTATFFEALASVQAPSWWQDISTPQASDKSAEEYGWVGHVPQMRQWTGPRTGDDLKKYNLTITNKLYQASLPFAIPDIRRDKSAQLVARAGELAFRAATFPNELVSTLISNGEAGTSGLAYDGQYFFDVDHNESGTNQTNDLTVTEVPAANVSDPDAPTATEAANIIVQTVSHAMFYTDDQGQPTNQDSTEWVIHVGNSIYAAAFSSALNQLTLPGSVTNPVAGLASMGYRFSVLANPRLSNTADKVYFFRRNAPGARAFILQEEEPITGQALGLESDVAFLENKIVYGVKWTGAAGYGRWQQGILVTLS
jgi:phage major head subunit gpT-like protein